MEVAVLTDRNRPCFLADNDRNRIRAFGEAYGRAVTQLLPKFGGKGVFAADVTFLTLGQVEELWDEVAIAMYPNRRAMIEMSMSPEWREIGVHREAGLKGQLNIETVLQEGDWGGNQLLK